jgi:hypothetical protein
MFETEANGPLTAIQRGAESATTFVSFAPFEIIELASRSLRCAHIDGSLG